MSKDVNCLTCAFCLRSDYGYSNWTVEGTTLSCLKNRNPGLEGKEEVTWGEERIAELAPILDFAETCPGYRKGAPAYMDVDSEGLPYGRAATWDDYMKQYTDDADVAMLMAEKQVGK